MTTISLRVAGGPSMAAFGHGWGPYKGRPTPTHLPLQVNIQYAEEHFADLAAAVDIIAQAITERLPSLTHDARFSPYPVKLIW